MNDLYEVPSDWQALSLYEIAGSSKSRFDDGDWIESEFISDRGIRLLQTGNIGVGKFKESTRKRYISEMSFNFLNCKDVLVGDLLVCRLADPAGRAAIIPDTGSDRMVTSVDVTIFRPAEHIAERAYLLQVFGTREWFDAVSERCGGSTRSRIARGALGKITIPVPPHAEQRSIAEALSDVDALIAALDALIAKKRAVKTAAMQQLLTGRQRLPGFSEEWETMTLTQIGEIESSGVDKKLVAGEVPVRLVNYMDVYRRDWIASSDLDHHVTAPASKASRCSVQRGDVFFTPSSEVREDIGHSAVALEDIPDAVYSYHVVRLRIREPWDLKFRAYAFKSKDFLDQASLLCAGSGTRYVISKAQFKSMTVAVPPVEEQAAIAEILFDMDAEIAALGARHDKTRHIKTGMMQELLTGRTRLVPSAS